MNLIKKIVFLCSLLLLFVSCEEQTYCAQCEEEEQTYCAQCYEENSGFQADDYCGSNQDVDSYVNELISDGQNAGQQWDCTTIIIE